MPNPYVQTGMDLDEQLGIGVERVAFAAGNGVANAAVSDCRDVDIKLEYHSYRAVGRFYRNCSRRAYK